MTTEAPRPNPYVGLRPFDRADSLYFFGRRGQVAELLQQLHKTRFLAVVGAWFLAIGRWTVRVSRNDARGRGRSLRA